MAGGGLDIEWDARDRRGKWDRHDDEYGPRRVTATRIAAAVRGRSSAQRAARVRILDLSDDAQ